MVTIGMEQFRIMQAGQRRAVADEESTPCGKRHGERQYRAIDDDELYGKN